MPRPTPAQTAAPPIRASRWRLRAATIGGASVSFGLAVIFNLGADGRTPDPTLQMLGIVVALAGLAGVIVSAAGSTWFAGLVRAQALGSVSVMVLGLIVLALRDGEPVTGTGVLGLVVGPLVLALILSGTQLIAWQPGAEARMQTAITGLRAELDQAVADVREQR